MIEETTVSVLAIPRVRRIESSQAIGHALTCCNSSTLLILFLCVASSGAVLAQDQQAHAEAITIVDAKRDREIPALIYLPARHSSCRSDSLCQVALLSSGYGIQHGEYSFIANALSAKGYLVAAIQHELPDDPPLSSEPPYLITRSPDWSRGVENLNVAREQLRRTYPSYDWNNLLLVGHSNGGDISALFASEKKAAVAELVTLDNRRVPLPRNRATRVLSIRASDFEADPDVLPSIADQEIYDMEIVMIEGAKHDDMHDGGNADLKARIITLIDAYID